MLRFIGRAVTGAAAAAVIACTGNAVADRARALGAPLPYARRGAPLDDVTASPLDRLLVHQLLRQAAARYLVPQRSVCVHAAPSRSGGGKKGDAKTDQAKKPREKKKAAPVAKKPVKQVVGKKPATKRVAKSASKKTAAKPAAKPASAKKPGGTK
jgi:hypothetical protein